MPDASSRALLIDTGGIAKLLGVSRAHVTDRLTKAPTFPPPVIDLSQRLRRWDRDAVLAWMTDNSRARRSVARPRA